MHWVRLGDIASKITKGTTPTSIGYDFVDEGINFIKIESITENGTFLQNKFAHITSECNEKLGRSQLNVNDILFSIAGAIGRTATVSEDILPANTNQAIAIIRVPEGSIDYSFLMYALESPALRKQYESQKQGVAQINLSLQNVSDFLIPKFGLDEQRRIAAVLDKVSCLIAKRREQLDKLDELVKARFVEMFGDPVSNPYNWEKVPLSELADIRIGPFGSLLHKEDYIEGGHPLVNPSHIIDGKIVIDEKLTVSHQKYIELEAYHLKAGDVVMGRRGEMGRCAVVSQEGLLCGTGSLLIRPKGKVTADYIQKIISFPSFKKTIEDMAVGQTMPNLNVPIVSAFQIIKPPMQVQENYYTLVTQVDKSKLTIQQSLDKLEVLKKALMQQYFG